MCVASDHWLVWGTRAGLHATDLDSGRRVLLPMAGEEVDGSAVDGDWVVSHRWKGKTGLYAYELSTGREMTLAKSGGANGPEVVGDWIVWNNVLNDAGTSHYRALNLVTGDRRAFSL